MDDANKNIVSFDSRIIISREEEILPNTENNTIVKDLDEFDNEEIHVKIKDDFNCIWEAFLDMQTVE